MFPFKLQKTAPEYEVFTTGSSDNTMGRTQPLLVALKLKYGKTSVQDFEHSDHPFRGCK
jgi:hypothetical protein